MALNIVRLKRTSDFDPLSNKCLKIIDVTVLTTQSEMTNSILKGGTMGDQLVWEVKHFFKRGIADRQPQFTVKDGQSLPNQV
jgi:hypothetical protein